mmetsp:Transcript_7871/g.12132  ORF Transcript_7871/g.12132 Transcript_7871/m.12132 type:complete len:185 (+) Transcript_7871:72-626(+)
MIACKNKMIVRALVFLLLSLLHGAVEANDFCISAGANSEISGIALLEGSTSDSPLLGVRNGVLQTGDFTLLIQSVAAQCDLPPTRDTAPFCRYTFVIQAFCRNRARCGNAAGFGNVFAEGAGPSARTITGGDGFFSGASGEFRTRFNSFQAQAINRRTLSLRFVLSFIRICIATPSRRLRGLSP